MTVRTEGEAGLAGEEGLPVEVSGRTLLHHAEHLGEDAADGPHINSLSVVLLEEDELWCSVPASHNVAGQLTLHVLAQVLSGLKLLHDLGAAVTNGSSLLLLFGWCCTAGGGYRLSRGACGLVVHVHDSG